MLHDVMYHYIILFQLVLEPFFISAILLTLLSLLLLFYPPTFLENFLTVSLILLRFASLHLFSIRKYI